jgi:hypothetical protein
MGREEDNKDVGKRERERAKK